MRGRMNDTKSYVPPFQLGEPMQGGAIGEVVESRADSIAVGTLVSHMAGWRDEAVLPAAHVQPLPDLGVDPQAFLGQFGMPGMTAYYGLLQVAEAKAGDTVFVSAAAGAVGSTVVQIAKAKGMTVIGSAGGADKTAWVRSWVPMRSSTISRVSRSSMRWAKRPRTGSTSISTMSAATIWTRRSPMPSRVRVSRFAA